MLIFGKIGQHCLDVKFAICVITFLAKYSMNTRPFSCLSLIYILINTFRRKQPALIIPETEYS